MATRCQLRRKLTPGPLRARLSDNPQRAHREEVNPQLIAQIVAYSLVWVSLVAFAVAAVAMAMGRWL